MASIVGAASPDSEEVVMVSQRRNNTNAMHQGSVLAFFNMAGFRALGCFPARNDGN